MSKNESGHVKNQSNYITLVEYVIALGPRYNPSNPAIALSALLIKKDEADNIAFKLTEEKTKQFKTGNKREVAMSKMTALAMRVQSAVQVSGAPKQAIDDVVSIVKKIRGLRAKASKKEETTALPVTENTAEDAVVPAANATPKPKRISVSHMSFDNRIQNFAVLIQILETIPEYAPNEVDISIQALKDYLQDLRNLHSEAKVQDIATSNKLLDRNRVFYQPITGMIDMAKEVKLYIKSVFGNSEEYKQVRKFPFKNMVY